jgi:hypothetical protein
MGFTAQWREPEAWQHPSRNPDRAARGSNAAGAPPNGRASTPGVLVAADSLMTGVVRKRQLPIKESKQLPSTDMVQLMFVIIREVTERTVVVLETS